MSTATGARMLGSSSLTPALVKRGSSSHYPVGTTSSLRLHLRRVALAPEADHSPLHIEEGDAVIQPMPHHLRPCSPACPVATPQAPHAEHMVQPPGKRSAGFGPRIFGRHDCSPSELCQNVVDAVANQGGGEGRMQAPGSLSRGVGNISTLRLCRARSCHYPRKALRCEAGGDRAWTSEIAGQWIPDLAVHVIYPVASASEGGGLEGDLL